MAHLWMLLWFVLMPPCAAVQAGLFINDGKDYVPTDAERNASSPVTGAVPLTDGDGNGMGVESNVHEGDSHSSGSFKKFFIELEKHLHNNMALVAWMSGVFVALILLLIAYRCRRNYRIQRRRKQQGQLITTSKRSSAPSSCNAPMSKSRRPQPPNVPKSKKANTFMHFDEKSGRYYMWDRQQKIAIWVDDYNAA